MLRYVFKVNKSTQIIFGFIGTVYGSYNIIEYYPKNGYNNLLNSYNNDINVLKDKEKTELVEKIIKTQKEIDFVSERAKKYNEYSFLYKLLIFPSIISTNLRILANEISKECDEETVKQIEKLSKLNTFDVEKPLFLIDENKFIENICLSSIFYGSVFSFFGSFPLITVPVIGFYGFYKQKKHKK